MAILTLSMALAFAAGSPPAADAERMICRRQAETGYISRRRRECRTQADWDRIAESQARGARRLADGLTSGQDGNTGPRTPGVCAFSGPC